MQLFDLHCDSIVKYRELDADFLCRETQFSLGDAGKFERLCQTMAIFIPDDIRGQQALDYFNMHRDYLLKLAAKQPELAEMAYSGADVERITRSGKSALMLAVESGAALAGQIDNVDYLAECGVQMMTLVWNGENEIGSGHQTDKGLSEFGRRVVKRMEDKGILVDVSHLNDRGFEEVCEIAGQPFIATHSNLRSICGHNRNLTEQQFGEIVKRGGLVGINLYEQFLADDAVGTVDRMFRHIYRMLELGGEKIIACGSDFDGADIDPTLADPVKFAGTAEYLLKQGIPQQVVDQIFFENALNFFMAKQSVKV